MEEVKYIPGDLVKIDNDVCQVKSVRRRSGIIHNVVEAKVISSSENIVRAVDECSVEPIPLTEELLFNNGWNEKELVIEESVIDYYRYTNRDKIVKVRYYPEIKTFEANLDGVTLCNIHYVHDLQHLLFGLGLNSSFKV